MRDTQCGLSGAGQRLDKIPKKLDKEKVLVWSMPEPSLDENRARDRDISQTEKLAMLHYFRDANL